MAKAATLASWVRRRVSIEVLHFFQTNLDEPHREQRERGDAPGLLAEPRHCGTGWHRIQRHNRVLDLPGTIGLDRR
jgi:hypothetical protein